METVQTQQLPTMVLRRSPSGFRLHPNWGIKKDVGHVVREPTLELVKFLKTGELHVKGTEMIKRAEVLGNLAGQFHAEKLLDQHYAIPNKWCGYKLVFAGTIRIGPHGFHYIITLHYCSDSHQWLSDFNWLGGEFKSDCRIVRLVNK